MHLYCYCLLKIGMIVQSYKACGIAGADAVLRQQGLKKQKPGAFWGQWRLPGKPSNTLAELNRCTTATAIFEVTACYTSVACLSFPGQCNALFANPGMCAESCHKCCSTLHVSRQNSVGLLLGII